MFRAFLATSFLLSITLLCGCASKSDGEPSPQGKGEQGDAGKKPGSTNIDDKKGAVARVSPAPLAAGKHIDLAYLPDGYNFAAVLHPQRILNHPAIPAELRPLVAEGLSEALEDTGSMRNMIPGPMANMIPDIGQVEQLLVMADSQLMEMMVSEGLIGPGRDRKEVYEKEEEVYEKEDLRSEKGDFKREGIDLKGEKFDKKDGFEFRDEGLDEKGSENDSFDFKEDDLDEKYFKFGDADLNEEGVEFKKGDSIGFDGEKGDASFDSREFKDKNDEFFEGWEKEFRGGRSVERTSEIPNFVVLIRHVEPIDFEMLRRADLQPRTIEGKSCYVSDRLGLGFLRVDERSILLTSLKNFPIVIKADPDSDDPLKNQLRSISRKNDFIAALVVPDQLRETASGLTNAMAGQLPPDFQNLTKLPSTLETLSLQVNLSGETLARVQVTLNDAELAKRLGSTVNGGLAMAKQGLAAAKQQPASGAGGDAAFAFANYLLDNVAVEQQERSLTVSLAAPENMNERVAVLLRHAREAAEVARQFNGLKIVGLAVHNHVDVFDQLPPAPRPREVDEEGKPLLSWRVRILPFLWYSNLYDQFKFDEPWDSEHNIKLLEQMPDEYKTTEDPTKTTIMMVVGEGTAYEGKEGLRFPHAFADGTFNTILVVRAGADKAVPWTKPADLPFIADNPVAALGEIEGNDFLVLMANGSVHRLPKDIAPEQLRALLTRAGGEDVSLP